MKLKEIFLDITPTDENMNNWKTSFDEIGKQHFKDFEWEVLDQVWFDTYYVCFTTKTSWKALIRDLGNFIDSLHGAYNNDNMKRVFRIIKIDWVERKK